MVGLTALIVGGVGVANAVRAFLETKRPVIATFKSLGAPGNLVFLTYLFQILIISLGGIVAGMVLGALMPLLAGWALEGILPLPQSSGVQWGPLGLGAVYGLLTALAFAVWPLGVAREIPATDLFRGQTEAGNSRWPKPVYLLVLASCIIALVLLAIYLSENRFIAVVFIGSIVFAFVLLRAVAQLIQYLARKAPRFRSTGLRMAVGNIHRPGSLTPSVVLSLGLGLALLVALALIDGNLRQQVSGNLPERAPDFFFVDIQNNEREPFEATFEGNNAGCEDFLGTDVARADHHSQGNFGRKLCHWFGRRMGTARGSRDHLCEKHSGKLDPDQGRMVAGRLFRQAAGFLFRRGGGGIGPRCGRHDYRQCSWPQYHGRNRIASGGGMGIAGNQFRDGVFAQYLCGRAALASCHA